jgi:hypothetical protein
MGNLASVIPNFTVDRLVPVHTFRYNANRQKAIFGVLRSLHDRWALPDYLDIRNVVSFYLMSILTLLLSFSVLSETRSTAEPSSPPRRGNRILSQHTALHHTIVPFCILVFGFDPSCVHCPPFCSKPDPGKGRHSVSFHPRYNGYFFSRHRSSYRRPPPRGSNFSLAASLQ